MDAIRIQARFLIAAPDQVYHPGQIVVRQGRIVELCSAIRDRADYDLGDCVLMPGLINAHTHLEFSDLSVAFDAGTSFPAWISSVVRHRLQQRAAWTEAELIANRTSAVKRGLGEAFRSGTVLLGDIVSPPWRIEAAQLACFDHPPVADSVLSAGVTRLGVPDGLPITEQRSEFRSTSETREHWEPLCFPRVMAFPEVLGLQPTRFEESFRWANDLLDGPRSAAVPACGLSPHAPYTLTRAGLNEVMCRTDRQTAMAMHLAESREELEWLERGSGPFREAFEGLSVPLVSDRPQISECIAHLSRRARGLIIHGNYLSPMQTAAIAAAPQLSVVYCPRTHIHFGHSPYPLQQFRDAGVRVVLGTDSRATNPDLNLWRELVAARLMNPWLDPRDALAMITQSAAEALGMDQDFGTLQPGKLGAAAVVPCRPEWNRRNLIESLTVSDAVAQHVQPWPLQLMTR